MKDNKPTADYDDEIRAYDILLKRHLNDDRLMAERMSIFLLASSFLFAGFATLLGVRGTHLLRIVVPSISIVLCFLISISAGRTQRGLDFWEEGEKKIEQYGNCFEYMRKRKVQSGRCEIAITPHSVYAHVGHGRMGWLFAMLRNSHIYACCMPLLFFILWLSSLIWVIWLDPT